MTILMVADTSPERLAGHDGLSVTLANRSLFRFVDIMVSYVSILQKYLS